MRILVVLLGVMALAYFVADRVRSLPDGAVVKITAPGANKPAPAGPALSDTAAAPAAAPATADAAPADRPAEKAAAGEPADGASPQAAAGETPADALPPRSNPVALVPLDAERNRFPAKPSDPVSGYALVMPAPATGAKSGNGQPDAATDKTRDVTQLRMTWPQQGVPDASASAPAPASAPVEHVAVNEPAAEPAPARRPQVAPAMPRPAALASREPVKRQPVARQAGPRARSAVEAPAVRRAATRAAARAEGRMTARAATVARASSPPAARRYASATPDRPGHVCAGAGCGPRLPLLVGVGF
ncbi:MAG: hypothetical protein J0H62_01970 [Rhizobiales bacterium]|nr:hypothetical protein [Hyphomicrobiales bacterium]